MVIPAKGQRYNFSHMHSWDIFSYTIISVKYILIYKFNSKTWHFLDFYSEQCNSEYGTEKYVGSILLVVYKRMFHVNNWVRSKLTLVVIFQAQWTQINNASYYSIMSIHNTNTTKTII